MLHYDISPYKVFTVLCHIICSTIIPLIQIDPKNFLHYMLLHFMYYYINRKCRNNLVLHKSEKDYSRHVDDSFSLFVLHIYRIWQYIVFLIL